jgi:hypothetical protein
VSDIRHFPNINRISILSGAIFLAYTLVGLIILPSSDQIIQLPGRIFGLPIDQKMVFAFLISGLTATGTNWLIRDHPTFKEKYSIQHWLLPALTSWGLGLLLFQQPFGFTWWIIFSVGGLVLILITLAEYIMVDPNDIHNVPATIGLTALSYALFLILAITIRGIEGRIFLTAITLSIAGGLTSLRSIQLQYKKWAFSQTAVIAIIIGELSAVLNYFQIGPVTFGLILLGPTYALTSSIGGLLENKSKYEVLIESILILCMIWGIAIVI